MNDINFCVHTPTTNTALSHTDTFADSKLVSTTNSFPEVLEHATLCRPLAPQTLIINNNDWRKHISQDDLKWYFKLFKKSKLSIHLNCNKGWIDGDVRIGLLNDLCCYNLEERTRAFLHDYMNDDMSSSDRIQAVFGFIDNHREPICIVRVRRDDDAEDLYYVPDFFFYRAACREDADDIDICYFNLTYIGAANIYFHSLTADEKAAPAIDWYYKTMTYIMLENGLATNEG